MKAVRLIKPGLPLELQELEIPKVGSRDVLVQVKAAGICHSDAHYRTGISRVDPLPLTLGHEVSGVVAEAGKETSHFKKGDRVCLHYMATCGHCAYCDLGSEQFCTTGKMIGKYRDGGYAEYILVPERSVFHLPEEVSFEQGAVMMCSSATSLHALNKTRIKAGESIAIFGIGGLGVSAIQLAKALGASEIFAVDIRESKLALAKKLGAIPISAAAGNPLAEIAKLTSGRGVDVALELIGLPLTMKQAVQSLAIMGRAGLVGLTQKTFEISPYSEVLNKEAEIIGVSDHLASEIPQLLNFARTGKLNLSGLIETVPLHAGSINDVLNRLEEFGDKVRVVINPHL